LRQISDPVIAGLLEAAPDATVCVDSRGRIVLVNDQAERLFGYPRDELAGQPVEILVPDARVVLLEPMARRAAFLDECVRDLGLGNATVRRGRAEDLAGELVADVVVARAVAPMERLAGLALGLVRPGGLVLAVKGAGAEEELARARRVLRRLGVRDAAVVQAGSGRVSPPATVVRLTAGPAVSRGRPLAPARTGARQGRAAGKQGRRRRREEQ